jgi:hypothetical protein
MAVILIDDRVTASREPEEASGFFVVNHLILLADRPSIKIDLAVISDPGQDS